MTLSLYLDAVCVAPDEAAAMDAFPQFVADELDPETGEPTGNKAWYVDGLGAVDEKAAITQFARWDYSDPEAPVLVAPEECAAGYWFRIALHADDPRWDAIKANSICRIVASRRLLALWRAGDSQGVAGYWVYAAADLDLALVATIKALTPADDGHDYPFGEGAQP